MANESLQSQDRAIQDDKSTLVDMRSSHSEMMRSLDELKVICSLRSSEHDQTLQAIEAIKQSLM
jgi:hypothetical protein